MIRVRNGEARFMANCAYCNSFILFGGSKDGPRTYCNTKCHQGAYYLSIAQQIPENTINEAIMHLNFTGCPACKGSGPVDVHTSHLVWSALILTSWSSTPKVSCRKCGVKGQLGKAAASLVVGWWGFPWGLIMTPVQVCRNISGILAPPVHPSPQLKKMIGLSMAAQMVAEQQQRAQTPPPFSSGPPVFKG